MTPNHLDRILADEQEIIPSEQFVASVMNAVLRERAALPPLVFPWKRALPGLCSAAIALIMALGFEVVLLQQAMPFSARKELAFSLMFQAWNTVGASWIILVLALSLISVRICMHFVSGQTESEIQDPEHNITSFMS